MKITWYGHACFKVETERGSVVIDPYSPGSVPGLNLPPLEADKVLCSHGHHDHNYAQGVRLSANEPGLKTSSVPCWHDNEQGRLRGDNLITVVDAEGLRLVHLGDLGHMLFPQQLEALGKVDVLLVPVGGFYTIDALQAQELIAALKPGIVVPMHYRAVDCGLSNIATVEEFLSLRDNVVTLGSSVLDTDKIIAPATVVLSVDESAKAQ